VQKWNRECFDQNVMDAVLETLQQCPRRETCLTRFAVEHAARGALGMNEAGGLLFVNQAACALLGYEERELLQMPLGLLSPQMQVHLEACAAEAESFEATCYARDHSALQVEVSLIRFQAEGRRYYAAFLHDLKDRKQLEQQLRQAHKMEAVGRLVDGVAHDFNNVLTAVMIYGGLLLNQLPPQSPSRKPANQILAAAEHGRNLIAQLLGFGRAPAAESRVSTFSLSEMLAGMSEMLRHLLGEDVILRVNCAADLAAILADRTQIEQVIMNLVLNARDAMAEGGKLTIAAENFASHRPKMTSVPWVRITVADTGCGMDAATLAHVFEPFFTTKPKGRGSGLGLATVHRCVTEAGGQVEIQSRPGRGTTVTVLLPAANQFPAARPGLASDFEWRGTETVLVVEDDEMVRRSVCEILGQRGYEVLAASDAGEARCRAREFAGRIHLLVTDLVLPGSSGSELAEDMKQIRPGMRVLYMSGYSEDARVRQLVAAGEPFCGKPFSAATLARKLREVLAEPETVASGG
jgi:two-component system cell cycle sensor histidine kinase/response regulator CckA